MVDLLFKQSPLTQPSTLLFGDDGDSVIVVPPVVVVPPVGYTPSGNLLFSDTAATNGNLLFVGSDASVSVPDITYTITASFPKPAFSATLAPVTDVVVQSTFPGISITATAQYNSDTARPVVGRSQTVFNAAVHVSGDTRSAMRPLRRNPLGSATGWSTANGIARSTAINLRQLASLRNRQPVTWNKANALRSNVESHFSNMLRNDILRSDRFNTANPLRVSDRQLLRERSRYRTSILPTWQSALALRYTAADKFSSGIAYQLRETERFQTARVPPVGISYAPVIKPPVLYVGDTNLVFAEPATHSSDLLFGNTYVIPGSTIVVPVRRTYIVLNDVQLSRIDGNHILPATSLQLNIDWDSWTWSFSASMPQSALSLVEPGQSGDLVILEATINGAAHLLLAENIQTDRAFGKSTINVSGRGKSAMLADPYSPILTFNSAVDRTAQQLMNDALTVNGISIGWAIDWRIDDWLVPANTWIHQGSYMSAVTTIAGAAGAFIQPDPVNQVLRIRSRHSVKPWEYASAIPDMELPSSVMSKEAISWIDNPQYNGIYVSGTTNSGVLAQVKRIGSAANNLAPMITDPLITAVEPARARGIAALANTGRNATYTLSLPVMPETGIIQPGTLVRYVDSSTVMGVVKGVAVSAEQSKVRQTIEVQTHG